MKWRQSLQEGAKMLLPHAKHSPITNVKEPIPNHALRISPSQPIAYQTELIYLKPVLFGSQMMLIHQPFHRRKNNLFAHQPYWRINLRNWILGETNVMEKLILELHLDLLGRIQQVDNWVRMETALTMIHVIDLGM